MARINVALIVLGSIVLIVLIVLIVVRFLGEKSNIENTGKAEFQFSEDELSRWRKDLLRGCGEVCNPIKAGVPGKYFDFIEKIVDCTKIFDEPAILRKFDKPPGLNDIPANVQADYTLQGQTGSKIVSKWSQNDRKVICRLSESATR